MKNNILNDAHQLRKTRNLIILFCLFLFLLMGLFPPWNAVVQPLNNPYKVHIGYRFLATPPHSPYGFESYVIINYTRILIQWGVLLLVTFVFYKFTSRKISKLTGE